MEKKENIEEIEAEDTSSGKEVIMRPFNPNDIQIETPPFTVGYLMDKLEYDEIDLNTEFQRSGDLWSEEQQSRLIESILLGLPLPAFYFDTSQSRWEIIDGLQRCCSIYNFCVKKELRLKGLEFLGYRDGVAFLEGKSYEELDRQLKRSLITRPITVNLIKQADPKVRFILFKRLNTGGLELTPAEIRHAVYQGAVMDFIKHLAHSELFVRVTEGRIPTKRMENQDFVSRFVAFYLQGYRQYKPTLDDYINAGLAQLMSGGDMEAVEAAFVRGLELAYRVFGHHAFRKRVSLHEKQRKPINKAYFEVTMVVFGQLDSLSYERLWADKPLQQLFQLNLLLLMEHDRYNDSLSRGTGTRDSVQIRFGWYEQVLHKSLEGKQIRISDDNRIESL